MKTSKTTLLMALALGLATWTVHAQDAGPPPQRGGRSLPRGGGFPGGGRGGGGMRGAAADFSSAPLAKDEAEQKILSALDSIVQNQGRGMSVTRDDGRLLRLLVESMGATNVIELGTFHGYSGTWMCLGLRTTGGKLTTFEIDKDNAALSRQNFKRAGVESLVTLVEGDAHKEVSRLKDPIDLVFIDADKEGYLDYLNKLLPLLRPGGLIVAHNMNAGQADPNFVKAITTNTNLETIFVNAGNSGIGLTMKKR